MPEDKPNPPKRIYPVAQALRKAGYIPLPNLWVRPEDMPKIHEIAGAHKDAVNTIRAEIHERFGPEGIRPKAKKKKSRRGPQSTQTPRRPDPKTDPDAAWAAYQGLQKAGAR